MDAEEARREAEVRRQADDELAVDMRRQTTGLPQTKDEWLAVVGRDNLSALDALVGCEHDRAKLLARAAYLSENFDHRLSAKWIQALLELDRRDIEAAETNYTDLVPMDDDIDTLQQASLVADQLILELRTVRRDEDIVCAR